MEEEPDVTVMELFVRQIFARIERSMLIDKFYTVEDDVEGDLDGDGVVAVSDAIVVLDAIISGEATEEADINGDGKVNLIDILSIIAKLVK